MLDIKIINGDVLDGTGGPASRVDIGITGDAISDVGNLAAAEARVCIDARGKLVTPGFIDAHSHSDTYLLIEPSAPSKVFQGIATEVVGNCGASAAPRLRDDSLPSDWMDKKYGGKWRTVSDFRRLLEQARPAPNQVLLIGHKALRTGVMGYERRPATAAELDAMCGLLDESLDQGGRGFSTGLVYAPGMFAGKDELVALARVAGRHGGIYTSHIRSEGARLIEALEEAIAIGREGGVSVQVSHLKTSGRANWPLIDSALDTIRKARAQGLDVMADRYPYLSSCTDLDVMFPDWVAEGGREATLKRLRDPATRARLRAELLKLKGEDYWPTVTVASISHPGNAAFQGRPLPEVAAALKMHPVDAILHLTETDELRTSAFFHGMCEPNMLRILAEPYVMIGTDASLRAPTGPLSLDFPHPRAYGAFSRFLRMALDGKTVSLPDAIRKMTSLPAGRFGLKGRGTLAKGMKADVAVFNPAAVAEKTDCSNPHRLSEGLCHLVVNGTLTIADGKLTGERGGKAL
jgi:N-acyl-D-amino-acid deacylase